MKSKGLIVWGLVALSLVLCGGTRAGRAGTATSATSTSSGGTDAGTTTAGQRYDASYTAPDLSTGSPLTENAAVSTWRNVSGTITNETRHDAQYPMSIVGGNGYVHPNPNDPIGHFWCKGFTRRFVTDNTAGNGSGNGNITWNSKTYTFYAGGANEAANCSVSLIGDVRPRSSPFTLCMTNPGEMMLSAFVMQVPISATTFASGIGKTVVSGNTIPMGLGSATTLNGNNYSVVLKVDKTWHVLDKFYDVSLPVWNDVTEQWVTQYVYTVYLWTAYSATPCKKLDHTIRKLLANDAAIDTRKGYGDAIKNDEGKLVADPNADWTDYNFGTSLYKGGLFVGKMPAGNQDHSGTSRTQLYLPGGAISQTILSTLTMYYLGSPAHGQSAITIGAYYPSQTYQGQTDPNYATSTESNVKWSTRWLYLTQENSVSFPPSGGPPVNSWVNWTLTPTVANNTSKLTAMLTDETGTTPLWYYFSSKENATATGVTYPVSDSQARVWLLDQTAVTTWGGF